ncbi:hypothetical protein, partial [Pantoea agglomerans]|uniref:hypothetical protein n=1 Tax=Enterobacter agglomerans TaxID=549 RepID=UPI003DA0EA8D
NLLNDGQFKGQRVIALCTFNILFHHILLKTPGKCVNAIQDGSDNKKRERLRRSLFSALLCEP